MSDDNDGILTDEQGTWLLIHQSRCSKLEPEKREFRRAILLMTIRPECREDFLAKLDEVGLADCYGKDAEYCVSN